MLLNPAQSRRLFSLCLERGCALLAINADSPAALVDCLQAAKEADSALIIETSLWQLTGPSFGAGDPILGLARYAADLNLLAAGTRFASVPVILHTDHIKGPQTEAILSAAILGALGGPAYSTISLDSSELSDEQNIAAIGRLAELARAAGRAAAFEVEAAVDGELTTPEQTTTVVGAIEQQHPGAVALYAPGLGTRHGFSDDGYPKFTAENVKRQAEHLQKVCGRPVGLALHGSSGLEEARLAEAVKAGIVKVNWSSDSLYLRSNSAAAYYASRGGAIQRSDKDFKAAAMDQGVADFVSARYVPVVKARLQLLHASGLGSAYRSLTAKT